MEFVIIYALFALSVAVVSNITFTQYAINEMRKQGVENQVTEHPVLMHLSMFVIHILIAPAMTYVLFWSSSTNRLQTALIETLSQD